MFQDMLKYLNYIGVFLLFKWGYIGCSEIMTKHFELNKAK